MKTFTFSVSRRVIVTLDDAKFDTALMEEFNSCVSNFGTDEYAYNRHAERIALLYASGVVEFLPTDFVEGYGPVSEAGISVETDDDYEYIERVFPDETAGAA